MIREVTTRYFKRFGDETFDLPDNVVLAGPNNTGKTTLLQAVAVWRLALDHWLEKQPARTSQSTNFYGVPISRKDFTAIPLREMNLLWTGRSTSTRKYEATPSQKAGARKVIEITVSTVAGWTVTMRLSYQSSEQIYVAPAPGTSWDDLEKARQLTIAHVPPFSGIGAEETRYDRPYQDAVIGQGKPGDILRNLLLEASHDPDRWAQLQADITELFQYKLLTPLYGRGQRFIVAEYEPLSAEAGSNKVPRFDLASAGSGFHQVLTLLAFMYARPASVLLLDEPDAHQHVVLQRSIYDRLRRVARQQNSQIIIATHSEILLDATEATRIVSFYRKPHILAHRVEREQVREALRHLTSMDMLLAEQSPGVLYVEDYTDLDILREWARQLGHPANLALAQNPFWHGLGGRKPREAKNHFFALQAIRAGLKGYVLLDGDNREEPEREVAAERLSVGRWQRYEIESYLIHPATLRRFVEQTLGPGEATAQAIQAGMEYLETQMAPPFIRDPLPAELTATLRQEPISKKVLPGFLQVVGLGRLQKSEYYQIAAVQQPDELPPEVTEKLDAIAQALGL